MRVRTRSNQSANLPARINGTLFSRQCDSNVEIDRSIEEQARQILEQHPHFHGRSKDVRCCQKDGALCLEGVVPSYYLKQLAQEALRDLKRAIHVENRIAVASPTGQYNHEDNEINQ